jgi:osmotically-inducible protein OsmY
MSVSPVTQSTAFVVCTTAGPFARYGSELVCACAEAGTHYCDLTGEVPWQFQRLAAEGALRHLYGVKGIVNSIRVKPHVKISDVKARIEDAFKRSAEIDAKNVRVEAHDGVVTLRGRVRSLVEREAAEQAAWAAAGVVKVEDQLLVAV